MKTNFCLFALITFSLASCNTVSVPTVTNTQTPTSTSHQTEILTNTSTQTRTPRPTATPLRELTAEDVGLPFDLATTTGIRVDYMPCYVNTETRFHAGDLFYFNNLPTDTNIRVVAPISGRVVYMHNNPDTYLGNIIVEAPFLLKGEKVFLHMVHFHSFDTSIGVRSWLDKGDIIGYITKGGGKQTTKDEASIDMMLYHINGPYFEIEHVPLWEHYFDIGPFVADDLIPLVIPTRPRCEGNPK
jgi:hypothetical protein